jgi:hypothetical protein
VGELSKFPQTEATEAIQQIGIAVEQSGCLSKKVDPEIVITHKEN